MRPLQKNEFRDSAWQEGKTPFELKINQLRMFLKQVFLIHYHSWPKGHEYNNEWKRKTCFWNIKMPRNTMCNLSTNHIYSWLNLYLLALEAKGKWFLQTNFTKERPRWASPVLQKFPQAIAKISGCQENPSFLRSSTGFATLTAFVVVAVSTCSTPVPLWWVHTTHHQSAQCLLVKLTTTIF